MPDAEQVFEIAGLLPQHKNSIRNMLQYSAPSAASAVYATASSLNPQLSN